MKMGLLGRGIGYSKSKIVHELIFDELKIDAQFDLIDEELTDELVAKTLINYKGFNVTKPYKNEIKKYLKQNNTVYGVNTIKNIDGEYYGYCTDDLGFICDMQEDGYSYGTNALILGAGGAVPAIADSLMKLGYKVYINNRTKQKALDLCPKYGSIYEGQSVDVVVNCTSLGFKEGENPLDMMTDEIKGVKMAYDLLYADTDFLKHFSSRGIKTKNGLGMLIYQALYAEEIFLDIKIDDKYSLKSKIQSRGKWS